MIRCHARPTERPIIHCLALLFLLLLTAHCSLLTAVGQSAAATLSGEVVDQNGAVVPGAAVMIVNPSTGFTREATTNDSGVYNFPSLVPGTYNVTVRRDGFAPIEVKNVVLNVGDRKALQIQLKAGDVNATVQVTNEAPLINESPAVGTVVDRRFVENMPLNGRSFQALIALTPGSIATPANFDDPGQFSVNGQRTDTNYFTVDGVSANFAVSTTVALNQGAAGAAPAVAVTGGYNNLVSVDALQEFKVQTSTYAPEFGRTPGAQVQILTRSGTNEFHGTAFEYFRNDKLDANDWFANSRRLPKPALRQNDFGGVLSGPLTLPRFGEGGPSTYSGKNRTFFFFSYEGLRLRQPVTAVTQVPSLNARQSASASIQPFLNAFPRPNGRDLANNLSEFNASFSQPSTLNATSLRVDYSPSSKLTLFARYNYAPSETAQRGGASFSLSTVVLTSLLTRTLTIGTTMTITPTISNEFRANYSRNRGSSFNVMDNFGGASPPSESVLFPPFASSKDGTVSIIIVGGSTFVLGTSANNLQRQINLVDALSVSRGAHQLRFGVDYRRLYPVFDAQKYAQADVFLNVNQVLSGRALVAILQTFGSRFPSFTNLSLFGQDTWKVTPRLSLTYGLRWEYNPPPSEKHGNNPFAITGLDNPTTLALAPEGTPFYKTTYDNFAPRIGMAYQLSKKRGFEVIVRGGFGLFYDLASGRIATSFANSFPNFRFRTLSNVPFPLDPASATPPPFSLTPPFGTIFAVDPDLESPFSYQWNLAVEQSLGSTQTVSASYVAAIGRRLLREEVFTNPNANFTAVNVTRNTGTSDYHALQVQFRRRLSRGLQTLASFTWSHSIDTGSSSAALGVNTKTLNPSLERGPSDFDVRHAFSAAVSYDVPAPRGFGPARAFLRDWSVDTIMQARSATPVNIITGADPFSTNFTNFGRPDLVPGVPLYVADPTVAGGRRINKTAFDAATPTAAKRQGTLGRNALRAFPIWQLDLALRRQFNLSERLKLHLRAEFFNLFNHPNFGLPINNLTNALFGQSTQMLGTSLGIGGANGGFNPLYQIGRSRSTQLTLRLTF
jgi:hypothetical protein